MSAAGPMIPMAFALTSARKPSKCLRTKIKSKQGTSRFPRQKYENDPSPNHRGPALSRETMNKYLAERARRTICYWGGSSFWGRWLVFWGLVDWGQTWEIQTSLPLANVRFPALPPVSHSTTGVRLFEEKPMTIPSQLGSSKGRALGVSVGYSSLAGTAVVHFFGCFGEGQAASRIGPKSLQYISVYILRYQSISSIQKNIILWHHHRHNLVSVTHLITTLL